MATIFRCTLHFLVVNSFLKSGNYHQNFLSRYLVRIVAYSCPLHAIEFMSKRDYCYVDIQHNYTLVEMQGHLYCHMIIAEKATFLFSSPSSLLRVYQCVQQRRQYLSKFICTFIRIVILRQFFSAVRTYQQLSKFSVRTIKKSVGLCQSISVMSVQNQYLSKFVSKKVERKTE